MGQGKASRAGEEERRVETRGVGARGEGRRAETRGVGARGEGKEGRGERCKKWGEGRRAEGRGEGKVVGEVSSVHRVHQGQCSPLYRTNRYKYLLRLKVYLMFIEHFFSGLNPGALNRGPERLYLGHSTAEQMS